MTKKNTPPGAIVNAHQHLAHAEKAQQEHLDNLSRWQETLADLQSRPREVTGEDFSKARGEIERLTLASPSFADDVANAEAELRYALAEDLSATLPGTIVLSTFTDALDADEANVVSAIATMAGHVETWNTTITDAIGQCREVGLIERQCDPMAPVFVRLDGRLQVHGETFGTYRTSGTIGARVGRAVETAGYPGVLTATGDNK